MIDSKYLNLSIVFLLGLLLSLTTGCATGSDESGVIDGRTEPIDESQLLDDTFRIDIQSIQVTYDIHPDSKLIEGKAIVNFKMRNGQNRPLIHFNPAVRDDTVMKGIWLNEELLDFTNDADVRIVDFETTPQRALEFVRDLSPSGNHVLRIVFQLTMRSTAEGFYTDVNDIAGIGNEELFPTINTPHELARHVIRFNVHGERNYRLVGSGNVVKKENNKDQCWDLDTEREVASYTVMFVLMPADLVDYEETVIEGVRVRAMSYQHGTRISNAFNQLETWIPELITNLGPFPMKRGLSLFLTQSGGGMEYFGGSMTSLWALKHEVFHMYFGCSTIAKTYRDSWWDEAINMWYENSLYDPNYPPIEDDFRSNMVGARSPISIGFNMMAYDEGARIIEAVARELGGRSQMIDFLSYLYQNHVFSPFNTFDFIEYLKDYSGADMYDKFLEWLYNGTRTYYQTSSSSHKWRKKVDMTPPPELLKKIRSQ